MNSIKKYNWPLTLILFSMILLGVFLGLWLKRVYQDEVDFFQKESSFLFSDAMQEWTKKSFNKIVKQSIPELPDSTIQVNHSLGIQTRLDSVISISNGNTIRSVDTFINLQFNHDTLNNKTTKRKLTKTNITITEANGKFDDASNNPINNGDLIVFVQQKFEGAVVETGLPTEFRIININTDSAFSKKIITSKPYKDFLTNETYAVEFKEPHPYIFKQMIPEILFSLLLFSCIALAFEIIYKTMQKQKRLNELKNDFVNNITHELKTPITTVGVAMEALSDFDVLSNSQKTNEYLAIAKHELKRLTNLVDRVLSISLYEQTAPELKIEEIDLKKQVKEIINSMLPQFEKQNVKLEFNATDKNYFLEGDKVHLTNVIYNLLDNALKYCNENPIINIDLSSNENVVLLKVKDNGIGIPDVYKNKIFDKFFRVPTGDQHNVKGYGLGLNYVANVIRQHGGHIQLKTTHGQGSNFIIQFPKQYD